MAAIELTEDQQEALRRLVAAGAGESEAEILDSALVAWMRRWEAFAEAIDTGIADIRAGRTDNRSLQEVLEAGRARHAARKTAGASP